MERSRTIFRDVARAADKVVTSATEYANRKNECRVQRSHFQLEAEMRRISVACQCIADALGKTTPPALDVRLQDWLSTDGPKQCLDTLVRMERLFQNDASSLVSRIFRRGRGVPATEDKIKEAAENFGSRKACFHFLFSADIWNTERNAQRPQDHIVQLESDLVEPSLPFTVQMEINATVPIQGAHHELETPLPVQMELDNTPSTAIPQGENLVGQGNCETMPDQQQKKEEQAKKLEGIVKWLEGFNCAEKQDDTLLLRQPDTCGWLFDNPLYKMWRNGQNSFLWLRGKPGAGKSVLASAVINSLETTRRGGELLAFFYCDFRRERSTSSAEVLRSILSQLLYGLRGSTIDPGSLFEDMIKVKERGGSARNNAKQLAGFVSRVAVLPTERPMIVIDALDECKDARVLLQALMVIRDHVRLFVTSRPLHVIAGDLSGLPFIAMDDMEFELLADIQLHVTRELHARHRLRDLDAGFKAEILSVLCEKAGGMFRWIQCSIDTLDRCATRKEVRSALDNLPDGLDETYERILLAIDMTRREGLLAHRALTWLVAALRPLRLSELVEGLSIDLQAHILDADFGPMHHGALLDACGSLVTHSDRTDVIFLSHFSVKEYLLGDSIRKKLPQHHINWECAHLHLARSCICYLSICLNPPSAHSSDTPAAVPGVSSELTDRLHMMSWPLRKYVLDNAIDHFGHLGPRFESVLPDVKAVARMIQQHPAMWNNICRSARRVVGPSTPSWPTSKHDLIVYILVAYAADSLFQAFLRHSPLKSEEGMNPLVYAAYFNKEEHARTLLSRGARLNRKGWDVGGFFQVLPIEVALECRHYAMVALFVREGSAVPSHIFTHSLFQFDQLLIPSSTAKMLLHTDDFSEVVNDPLNEAIPRLANVVKLLLRAEGTDEHDLLAVLRRFVQLIDNNFALDLTLLRFAVIRGFTTVARYLVSLDNSLSCYLLPTLGYSDGWMTPSMIQFLLENGIHAHARVTDPLLHLALRSSTDEVSASQTVRILIGHGCGPLEVNSFGDSPLSIAVERGFISVVQYLLSLGISLRGPDLLHVALRAEDEQKRAPMILCLLQNGARDHPRSTTADSVLRAALRSFQNEDNALGTVKLLVRHGCDPLATGSSGNTPIHIAVDRGFVSVVRYLLSFGIPPTSELLHVALRSEDEQKKASMIICLLESGANPRVPTTTGEPVLHTALLSLWCEDHALETTKALVSHGCDLTEASPSGKTPLQIAVEQGLVAVARYLLSLSVSPPPDLLRIALELEDEHEKALMTICLLENGANVHSCVANGDPILHTALLSACDKDCALLTAKALVSYGCDPLKLGPSGKTSLEVAVERGFALVVKYLLSLGIPPSPDLLHIALALEDEQDRALMIICLSENGVNVHARMENGDPVLHNILLSLWDDGYALETAKALVSRGCDPLETNALGKTALHLAVEQGLVPVVRYFLSIGISPSPDLLHIALELEDEQEKASMITCLLENGTNVHARGSHEDPVLYTALSLLWDEDCALEVAKVLTSYGCNPLDACPSGKTALRITVERGFTSVVRYILSIGISPPPDLLHAALNLWNEHHRASMIVCLLESGGDVPVHTAEDSPVLHTALRSFWNEDCALRAIAALVIRGCNPHEVDFSGATPLSIAVEHGFVSIARYLLSLGVSPAPGLLRVALKSEDAQDIPSTIICLLDNGINIHARSTAGDPVLHTILQPFRDDDDALHIARLLVDHGCNPFEASFSGNTLLHVAVERGFLAVTRYLLSLGSPVSSDLLLVALLLQNDGQLERLLSRPADEDAQTIARACTAIETSTEFDVLQAWYEEDDRVHKILKLLTSYGCSPLEPNIHGTIPLCVAVEQRRIIIARILPSLCAPSSSPDNVLWIVLSSRQLQPKLQVVDFLIGQGASVLAKAPNGDTFLHAAITFVASDEILQIVAPILGRGCDPTIPNILGVTPFHLAVQRGCMSVIRYFLWLNMPLPTDILFTAIQSSLHSDPSLKLEIVKTLVASGCHTRMRNASGLTPLDTAYSEGRIDAVNYLLSGLLPMQRSVGFSQ